MAPQVALGQDGWVSVRLGDDLVAHIHLVQRGPTIVVDGLLLEGNEITTDTFRRIHPSRIMAMARDQLTRGTYDRLWRTDGTSRPGPGPKKPGEIRLSSFATSGDAETELGDLRRRVPNCSKPEPEPPYGRELLGRPTLDDLDGFYERVAKAYVLATTESGRPASLLAEENGTPVNTVYKWIREARRRGHLEPGRRGRAG